MALIRHGYELIGRGPETLLDSYGDLFTDDFEWTPVLAGRVDPDRVLVLTRFQASGTGGGVPLSADIAHLWKLRDGRIAAGRTFLSEREARKHLSG